MRSLAAEARIKTDRLMGRGVAPPTALQQTLDALEDVEVKTATKGGDYPMVVVDNASRTRAEKAIQGVTLECDECGREIWCDLYGRGRDSDTFQIGAVKVHVCDPCQRSIVTRHIVGE